MSASDAAQTELPSDSTNLERRRPERTEYTNPHLVQLLRGQAVTDRELLERRFHLARRAVSLARSAQFGQETEAVRLDLELCEAECRRRGLISS